MRTVPVLVPALSGPDKERDGALRLQLLEFSNFDINIHLGSVLKWCHPVHRSELIKILFVLCVSLSKSIKYAMNIFAELSQF